MSKFYLIICSVAFIASITACTDTQDDFMGDTDFSGDNEISVDGDLDIVDSENDMQNSENEESQTEQELEGAEQETELGTLRVMILDDDYKSFAGPNAQAIAGDYLIANSQVQFVIQGENRPRSWIPYGGTLIDADVIRENNADGQDNLGELSVITGILRAFKPESFEIISNGTDGLNAHLRVFGTDWGIPVVDLALPFFKPFKLDVQMDYILLPDDNALEITTTIKNNGDRKQIALGEGLVWGNRLNIFTPGLDTWGQRDLANLDSFPFQAAFNKDVAYGLLPIQESLNVTIDQADILPIIGFNEKLNTGDSASYSRLFIVANDLEGILKRIHKEQQTDTFKLTVNMDFENDTDMLDDLEIQIFDEDHKPVSQVFVDGNKAEFMLPNGTYFVGSRQIGRPDSDASDAKEITIADGEQEITLTVPDTGLVEFQITGHDHNQDIVPIPARIVILQGADAALNSYGRYVYTSGSGSFLLSPGTYTLVASRGYEYDYFMQNITVQAGQNTMFVANLERVVDTTGWVTSDLHMHTERSIDSSVLVQDRVLQMAGVGLEVSPITDHDVIWDLSEIEKHAGVEDFIRILPGIEVSPPWAHTNGIILDTVDDDDALYFGLPWHLGYDEGGNFAGMMQIPEVWEVMRTDYNTELIQINHPRSANAYFDNIDYNPLLGLAGLDSGRLDDNFDAFEIINSGNIGEATTKSIADWYSLLNQGIHVCATATSDSHGEADPGCARNYVLVDKDDPNEITNDEWLSAIKGLHSVASTGPFMVTEISGAGSGDTHQGAGPYDLEIKVQAPPWMAVDLVQIIINGKQVHEFAVSEKSKAMRVDEIYQLESSDSDFWVVVIASAPGKDNSPVYRGQGIMAVSNPIFVDVDSNGYTAPGLD